MLYQKRNVTWCQKKHFSLFIQLKHMLANGKNVYVSVNHG